MKERFYGSLILGAITGAVVAVWSGTSNHAKLAAEAARHHTTVAATLAAGFIIITLVVAGIVFVLTSIVLAGKPQQRQSPRYGAPKARPRAGTRR